MKKFISILMTLVMTMSLLCVNAFAANTHVITITNKSEAQHTYEAYQVFTGDYNAAKDVLSNIKWGAGVEGAALLADLNKQEAFKDCETAEDVANVLAGFTTAQAEAFADVVSKHLTTAAGTSVATKAEEGYSYSITVSGDGYYLVKDQDNSTLADGDSYTDYILQVVGDVEMAAKSGTVVVEKEVATGGYACGNTDAAHVHSIAACGLAYADANTAKIGDVVSFKVSSTVPAEAAAYDYYFFIFGDKLSNGLTFDKDNANIVVTIGGEAAVAGKDYTVSTDYSNYTFAIALTNAKAHAGETVVATYEATVNENAVIGLNGNTNDVTVEYSKNPNEDHSGKKIPGDGFPADGTITPNGETVHDKTKTYVTEINLLKVDAKDHTKTLANATFAISGTTESVVVRTKDVFTPDNENGTYYKLKDQSYTTDAPVQEHMEKKADRDGGYVICGASDAKVAYTINNVSYRVATTEEMAGTVDLYTHIASNEALYESTTDKYAKETETVYECTPETFSLTGTTAVDGTLVVSGLNAGTYTITELIAPDGYNLLKNPITVNVSSNLPTEIVTGDETCSWTYTGSDNNTIGTVLDNGTVQITIENNSGTSLPETGGMGTTLFYVIGGILVAAAAVVFVTKKRMGAED